MQFSQVIGQQKIKERLIQNVKDHRISHAQLFLGKEGSGNLALALAYAQYVLCTEKGDEDSCGKCSSCIKFQKLVHPDLHFAFPVATNNSVKTKPTSKDFMVQWRAALIENPYLSLSQWLQIIQVENKQGNISVHESDDIVKSLSLKAYESQYKVMLIWMPENMNIQTANKLLKQIEEPEAKTLILLVANDEEQLISTIRSRTQLVKLPQIEVEVLKNQLMSSYGLSEETALRTASFAEGSWLEAKEIAEEVGSNDWYFEQFQNWMRVCYKADIEGIYKWVENISNRTYGREKQKGFLKYALSIVRESIVINYADDRISNLQEKERQFVSNFAPFVHGHNVISMFEIMNQAHYHIERNAYPKILFMDLSMQFANLLHIKNVPL